MQVVTNYRAKRHSPSSLRWQFSQTITTASPTRRNDLNFEALVLLFISFVVHLNTFSLSLSPIEHIVLCSHSRIWFNIRFVVVLSLLVYHHYYHITWLSNEYCGFYSLSNCERNCPKTKRAVTSHQNHSHTWCNPIFLNFDFIESVAKPCGALHQSLAQAPHFNGGNVQLMATISVQTRDCECRCCSRQYCGKPLTIEQFKVHT